MAIVSVGVKLARGRDVIIDRANALPVCDCSPNGIGEIDIKRSWAMNNQRIVVTNNIDLECRLVLARMELTVTGKGPVISPSDGGAICCGKGNRNISVAHTR